MRDWWEGAEQDVVVCCAKLGQLVRPLVTPQSSVSSYPSEFHRVSGGYVPDGVETFCKLFCFVMVLDLMAIKDERLSVQMMMCSLVVSRRKLQASRIAVSSAW